MYWVHFIDKVLAHLTAYIPLMQTLVWPVVILVGFFAFRSQLRQLADAIRHRIELGGGFKAWMFEFAPVTNTSPQEQAKKLEAEVTEEAAVEIEENLATGVPASEYKTSSISAPESFKSRLLAEDLVLKKLSSEQNLNIRRQVKASKKIDLIFDGVANQDQGVVVIEVKMPLNVLHIKSIATKTLNRINEFYTSMPTDVQRKFRLIFAVVLRDGNLEEVTKKLTFVRDLYQFPIQILIYRFQELQEEFGIKS